ncbi:MAG: hypothetical protein QGG42_07990 [Phycisphaerae bacterium]|jgi:hypothetical protein|nr:hypothetical protein [Phycisphaerae bacterium]
MQRSFALTLAALLLSGIAHQEAPGAVFQYRVSVATEKSPSEAFCWIPAKVERIGGVVVGGMTLMEREMARDAVIRKACADEGLAILFLKCGLLKCDLQKVLDDFARLSGYEELRSAPLMFVGHSAGGPQARTLATKLATRCFGLVQYRGGGPGSLGPGVPALMMLGQFDEFGGAMRRRDGRETWEGGRDQMAGYRAKDTGNLGSVVVEPGAGHFAWSDRNAKYLALFIRKAARARIGAKGYKLKRIDYRKGWLGDMAIKTAGKFPPAPYDKYKGDKTSAAWYFDEEIALATKAYHAGGFGKKDQFIKWNDPYWVDAGTRFFFTKLKWVGDGRTLRVHPEYAKAYPKQYKGRGPRWLDAGKSVGCSSAPIRIKPVSGPVVALGSDTFRMRFDGLAPAGTRARVTFMAFSEGDGDYRYTEIVGMMPRGFGGLKKGKAQTITFPPIGNLKSDSPAVELKATSDSGLPVEYYVACGPAVITDGKLKIRQLPRRAKYPIEVKVVAWQFGSGVEPLVRTAEPVAQTIRIDKR